MRWGRRRSQDLDYSHIVLDRKAVVRAYATPTGAGGCRRPERCRSSVLNLLFAYEDNVFHASRRRSNRHGTRGQAIWRQRPHRLRRLDADHASRPPLGATQHRSLGAKLLSPRAAFE